MPIDVIAGIFVKILLMVALGFLLKKRKIITPELQRGLSGLLLKAILPVSILASANASPIAGAGGNLLLCAAVAAGYYAMALTTAKLLGRAAKLGDSPKKVFITMTVFANTAFVGFPLVKELFGSEGSLYAVIYNLFYQILFFTYGINLLSSGKRIELKAVFTNIVTIASLVSILLFLSPFRLPGVLVDTLSAVGGMTVPLSMIIIGCSLADIEWKLIFIDKRSYLVSALRLMVFPMLMALILWKVELPDTLKGTCIMMTALPSGSLNAIYAEQYGCDPAFAVRTVIQTMLLMVGTIPVILIVSKYLLY